jgi:nitrate reductase beta subunit
MPRDVRKAFTERVKEIDPMFKAGDLDRFWPALRDLVAMAPHRRDLSVKKSHYLASLAARSLIRDDPKTALEFLELADREVDPEHMTAFLRREREDFRAQAELALRIGEVLAQSGTPGDAERRT